MASFNFGTGQSSFFTINRGPIHFLNEYRNQRRVDEHFRFQDPSIDRDAIVIRDTSLPLSMRLAAWDRWKVADAKAESDWVNTGRPPCTWCLRVHPPPHVSRENFELRYETRWAGRKLESGRGPCRRCVCHHGRRYCRTPQCLFCNDHHWEQVPCGRAARRRAVAGLPPVELPQQHQQQREQHEAEEERRVETMSFEAMMNTIHAMNTTPLDFPTMTTYWNSFLNKADIDPYDLRFVASGAMRALAKGSSFANTAALAMYLAPLLGELAQIHPSRFRSVLSETMSAYIRGAIQSIADVSNVARLVDSIASYLARNATSKRRMDENYDSYSRNKRMRPEFKGDELI